MATDYTSYSVDGWALWVRKLAVVAVFAGFVAVVWFAASEKDNVDAGGVIQPEEGPVKVRPENAGGMQVGNTDKEVFDLLATKEEAVDAPAAYASVSEVPEAFKPQQKADARMAQAVTADRMTQEAAVQAAQERANLAAQQKAEELKRLAALEEQKTAQAKAAQAAQVQAVQTKAAAVPVAAVRQPVAAAAVAPARSADGAAVVKAQAVAGGVSAAVVPVAAKVSAAPAAPKQAALSVEDEAAAASAKLVAAKEEKARKAEAAAKLDAKKEEKVAAKHGGWGVQVGSVPSESAAKAEIQKTAAKLGSLVSGLKPDVQKVTLEGKGTFYRMRFMGVADKASAVALCKKISAKAGSCLYVAK